MEPGEGELKRETTNTAYNSQRVTSGRHFVLWSYVPMNTRACEHTARPSRNLSVKTGYNLTMSSRLKAKRITPSENGLVFRFPRGPCDFAFTWMGVNKGMIYSTTGVHLSHHSQCHCSALLLATKCAKCFRKSPVVG